VAVFACVQRERETERERERARERERTRERERERERERVLLFARQKDDDIQEGFGAVIPSDI